MLETFFEQLGSGVHSKREGMSVEIGTEENAMSVDKVYRRLLNAVHAGNAISAQADLVCQIELLSQEVNSGASFEQYFRWVRA